MAQSASNVDCYCCRMGEVSRVILQSAIKKAFYASPAVKPKGRLRRRYRRGFHVAGERLVTGIGPDHNRSTQVASVVDDKDRPFLREPLTSLRWQWRLTSLGIASV
jgi:hypothetical protein